MDRTKLGGYHCDEGGDFETEHGLPYTKRNCKLIQRLNDVDHLNCSLLRTTKISTEGMCLSVGASLYEQRSELVCIGIPCLPSDALQVPIKDDLKSMSAKVEVNERGSALGCKPACFTHDYEMSTETMPLTKKEPHFPNPG